MYYDFKECIIRLMQHPIVKKPISALTDSECEQAYDLISQLVNLSVDEEYSQLNHIQLARLQCQLGALAYRLNDDREVIVKHYKDVPLLLEKGGIDLSIRKWLELVSLRIRD